MWPDDERPPTTKLAAHREPGGSTTLAVPPTRVVKRLGPDQPGALKHAQRYGPALVCVRYRHDTTGDMRYTTVELIVDSAPVAHRRRRASAERGRMQIVAIHIGSNERALQRRVAEHGAVWDRKARVWYLAQCAAKSLDLLDRIV